VLSTLAVAVDEVDANDAGTKDSKAHEES